MKLSKIFFPILLLGFFTLFLNAREKVISIQNDPAQLVFETQGGFSRVEYRSQYPVFKNLLPGHPEIPVIAYQLIIPTGSSIGSVEIINYSETELPGNYALYPVQKEAAIGEPQIFTPPEPQVYQANQKYPAKLVEHAHSGNFAGHRIAGFLIYPVRYNPVTQKLYFYEAITFKIQYAANTEEVVKPERLFEEDFQRIERAVRRLVANPEEVSYNQPVIEKASIVSGLEATPEPSEQGLGVRYLVITSEALADAFEPLAEFKNKTGTSAEIRTLEWIKSNTHPGVDDAETLRNFIKWAYQKWGTQYVLLGGDTEIIPTRFVFSNTMTVSTDLYYSDLDGTWNYDGDSRFGEVEDSLDHYPEVYISRAPLRTVAEANNFVNKTLTYLKAENFPAGFSKSMLLIGANLWEAGDGAEVCELVSDSVPGYINITRLYEEVDPGSDPAVVLQRLNAGFNFIYSTTHGSYNLIKTRQGGHVYLHDLNSLENSAYSIWLLSSCNVNQVEANCFSEHFMNAPNGGGVGYIGSTSLDYPYGMMFMQRRMITAIYDNSINELSPANLLCKLDYIPWFSYYNGPGRQVYLTYNTLGDPQLRIWNNTITAVAIDLPECIYLGQNSLEVIAYVPQTDPPEKVAGATVCLYKEGDIWETAQTNANGEVSFTFEAHDCGTVYITVTKSNCKPYLGSLAVEASESPHLRLKAAELAYDSNENGKAESGETIEYVLEIENNGRDMAERIEILINSDDEDLVNIIEGRFSVNSLRPGESARVEGYLRFSVANSIPVDTSARFTATMIYGEEVQDTDQFVVSLMAPDIKVSENDLDALPGPMIIYQLTLQLSNYGSGASTALSTTLTTNNPIVMFIEPEEIAFSPLEPAQSGWGNGGFYIHFSEPPSSSLGEFTLLVTDEFNREWVLLLNLATAALAAPEALAFQPESETSLGLSWSHPDSSEEMRYNIYRRIPGNPTFSKLNSLPLQGNTYYLDENFVSDQIYEYRIRAIEPSGRISNYSASIFAWGAVPAQNGFPKFENDLRIGLEGDAVAFDFNGGDKEIVAPGKNGQLFIYNSTGSVYHQFSGLEGNLMNPAFGNVDADPAVEMLLPGYINGADGNKIYIFDCSTLALEYILAEPNQFSVNNVVLADIDGDWVMEIFAAGFGGNHPDEGIKTKSKLFAWKYGIPENGSPGFSLYASRVFEDTPYLLNPPAIVNLDYSGAPEIALGVQSKVLILNSQNLQTITTYDCQHGTISCQISIGDLDHDIDYELAFTTYDDTSSYNKLWVLEYTDDITESYQLQLAWHYAVPGIINLYGFSPSPTIGELDNNFKLEVALPSENQIYIFNDDGTLLSPWPVEWNSGTNSGFRKAGVSNALLGDINGDGNCNLIAASSQGWLYAFDIPTGEWIKGFPVKTGMNWQTTPFLADIDEDSDMEVIFQEHDGMLFVFDMPGSYSSPTLEWTMRYSNHLHNGVYTPNPPMKANLIVGNSPTLPGLPKTYALEANYPNPFNPATHIRYQLPEAGKVLLEIFNIQAQRVRQLENRLQESGFYDTIWDGRNDHGYEVASGIYFYRLKVLPVASQNKGFVAVRRMLLLK